MRTIVGIAVLVTVAAGPIYLLLFRMRDPRVRRLIPGIALTAAGVDLIVAAYLWWFDLGECQSRGDVVCVINTNQGFLTLLAVVIAAAGVWVSVLTTEAVRRRALRREHADAAESLAVAAQEIYHNLLHVALAFDGDELRWLPRGLTLDATLALAEPTCRGHLHPAVVRHLDALARNLRNVEEIHDRMEAARGPVARWRAFKFLKAEPFPLRGLTTTSLAFLFDCYRY
jgi:hypothetical protein